MEVKKTKTKTDAMQNVVVLQHLFRFLDLKDVKRCRRVSTAWHDAALTRFRDISSTTIDVSNGPSQPHDENNTNPVTLNDFLALVNNPDDPLQLVRNAIRHISLVKCEEPQNVPFDQLNFGCMIRSITLSTNIDPNKILLFLDQLNQFPNLQKLTLGVDNSETVEDAKPSSPGPCVKVHTKLRHLVLNVLPLLPANPFETSQQQLKTNSMRNLLERFPNINHLEVTCNCEFTYSNECELIENILDGIAKIREHNETSVNISHLNFGNHLRKSDGHSDYIATVFSKLAQLNLPLKTLKFKLNAIHMIHIKPTLEAYATSLQTLLISSVGADDYNATFLLPFDDTQLAQLTELKVTSTDFKFLKCTPNLCKLDLDFKPVRVWLLTVSNLTVARHKFSNLTTLDLTSEAVISPHDFRVLTHWMPAVTALSMRLDVNIFPILVNRWPLLTKLTIVGKELHCRPLHGYGARQISNIVGVCDYLGVMSLHHLVSLRFKDHVCHLRPILVGILKDLVYLKRVSFPLKDKISLERSLGNEVFPYSVHFE